MVKAGEPGFPKGRPELDRQDSIPEERNDPVKGENDERRGQEEPDQEELPGAVSFEIFQIGEGHKRISGGAG
jgi:hypothetical protein